MAENWLDIVSALSTLAAVVVALLFSARAEWRAIKSDAQRTDDDHRLQAVQVAAWLAMGRGVGHEARLLILRNGSSEPIYGIETTFQTSAIGPLKLDMIPPVEVISIGMPAEIGEPMTTPFSLVFTDAAGRRWRRSPNGALLPVENA